ncbi:MULTISPECIES: hypothetical protein [Nocardioides]|uniref:DMT family transporter n=1 Tax=Nocardioides vastitatis TaxID=2568655 RepID=A0ABW0ZP41_9ACTN|nr:hypothetical protein [Nocardioides sp.]THJ04039.1 hypothetical protein E7Z54_09140 [Nocardioides sp.]
MTDDAPSTGTPGSTAPPPPPGETVMRPSDPRPAPAVDNPDVPPPPGVPGSPDTTVVPVAPSTYAGPGGEPPGPPSGPIDADFPVRASKSGLTAAVVALGTGLLGAAVVIAAIKSREDGDLDWSNYLIGLGATAVLLVVALFAAATRRTTGGRAREEAITWPGTVGILATAQMIEVGLDTDERWVGYLIGTTIVVLSALGYLAARRAAFVVTAVVGLGLLYLLAFDDLIADRVDEDDRIIVVAAAIAVFVITVTVLGWLLPSRAVSGVAVGAAGVASYVVLLAVLLVSQFGANFFGRMPMFGDDRGGRFESSPLYQDADVWWIVVFAAILTALWALAATVSNHSGFSILAIAMPVLVTPLALLLLAERHPTYWSGSLAVAGGLLLLGGVLLARSRSRRTAREAEELSYGG